MAEDLKQCAVYGTDVEEERAKLHERRLALLSEARRPSLPPCRLLPGAFA